MIVTAVANVFVAAWPSILATAVGVFNAVYNVVTSVLSAAWTFVETVGAGLADAWASAMDLLGVGSVNAGTATQTAFVGIVKAAQWLADSASLAFNILSFGLRNFGDVMAAAMFAGLYQITRFGNTVVYFFSDVIPGYLTWFGRNWTQIFTDAATMTTTVFTNLTANVAGFFKALWGAMKGDGFDFDWKPLTEGFESALTELPNIAERQIGDTEAAFGAAADSLSGKLTQGLGQYLADQDAKTKAATDAIKGQLDGVGKGLADSTPKIKPEVVTPTVTPPAMPTAKMTVDTKAADAALDATKAKADGLKAVVAGSAEAAQLKATAQFDAMVKASQPAAPGATAPPGMNAIAGLPGGPRSGFMDGNASTPFGTVVDTPRSQAVPPPDRIDKQAQAGGGVMTADQAERFIKTQEKANALLNKITDNTGTPQLAQANL